ncbi:hypothetical protein TWF696_006755 [Orbilia brochopaga]|uniref:Phage portal protein n=1 Tax=Orbilia brochopaga TaxID=3140254 RepID=A0AAV9UQ75_9PEZI
MEGLPAPINDLASTVLRGQVIVIPEQDVPKAAYNYGPYTRPNDLPDLISGIPETSPLYEYNSEVGQYRLCWYGYEDETPMWPHPQICDITIPGAVEDFWEGTVWAPKHATSLGTDHLLTLGEETEDGVSVRRAVGAAVQSDGTIATTLYGANTNQQERLGFEFFDTSRTIRPGSKTISLDRADTERRFGQFEEWELEWFYGRCMYYGVVCDHPTNGRILYLANPYWRTNATDLWTSIPCQVVRLQLRYWYEDYRFRNLNPLNLRPGQLAREDPERLPDNGYDTIRRTDGIPVPRRITFIDENGDIEPPWTPEELAARRQALDAGEEYVRPYLQEIRQALAAAGVEGYAQESTAVFTDTSDDAALANPLFQTILNDILGEDDGDVDDEQVENDQEEPNAVPANNNDIDSTARLADRRGGAHDEEMIGHNGRMQQLLDRVMGIGNQVAHMAMGNAGRERDDTGTRYDIRHSDDLDLLANVISRGNDMNNVNGNRGAVGPGGVRLRLPGEEDQGYAADDSRLGTVEGGEAYRGVRLAGPTAASQQGGYCWGVLGRICETLTRGVGGLFRRISATPLQDEGTGGVEMFREPLEYDVLDPDPTDQDEGTNNGV